MAQAQIPGAIVGVVEVEQLRVFEHRLAAARACVAGLVLRQVLAASLLVSRAVAAEAGRDARLSGRCSVRLDPVPGGALVTVLVTARRLC
jgi:hypothetical protein